MRPLRRCWSGRWPPSSPVTTRRYLDFQSKLHAYSANNVMLVWRQHMMAYAECRVPAAEPTYIAGFQTWRALGRMVDKGQHGYAVLAPLRGKQRAAVDCNGKVRPLGKDEQPAAGEVEAAQQVIRGFKVEHVFDASQTRGPAAGGPNPKLLEGEAPAGLGKSVMEMIEAGAHRWTRCRTRRIWRRERPDRLGDQDRADPGRHGRRRHGQDPHPRGRATSSCTGTRPGQHLARP